MSQQDCPADLMSDLIATATDSDERGLDKADALLRDYGGDARLHFLRGSLLASLKRYGEAEEAMSSAVDAAPDFAIARFQLGFLQMTSGEAAAAETTWRPLENLPAKQPLRLFSEGLRHLMRDEFLPAIALLEEGMSLNTEIPPINGDMQLIVSEVRRKLADAQQTEEPVSSAQILLNQFGRKPTQH